MDKINKISDFIGKYIAIIVLIIAFFALFFSNHFLWIKTSYVNYLLMVIMFGMGLTLKSDDFVLVFSHPKEIAWGTVSQYVIQSLIHYLDYLRNMNIRNPLSNRLKVLILLTKKHPKVLILIMAGLMTQGSNFLRNFTNT